MEDDTRQQSGSIRIRPAKKTEWNEAMQLAFRTFLKFESEQYGPEGTKNFKEFVTDRFLYNMFLRGEYKLFVAEEKENLVGLISLRNGNHISLLFVEERYHRKGIGTALIRYLHEYMLQNTAYDRLTVNAAPYGIPFYHKIGFQDTGDTTTKDGITYIPMEFYL